MPFCRNTCYLVGLMLFTRTLLSITDSVLSNAEHTTMLVIESSVVSGIALIPWLQHKIYQNNFVNVLEGSFNFNLIILSIATYHATQENKNHQLILSYVSVSVVFNEFLAILIFHVWHQLNLKGMYRKWMLKHGKITRIEVLSKSNQCEPKVKNFDKPRRSVSTSTLFDIREPLLEDETTEL